MGVKKCKTLVTKIGFLPLTQDFVGLLAISSSPVC